MEFLRIRRLTADLARRPLSAPDTAKYLAAQGALLSILFIPTPAEAPADWPFLAYPLLALLGVYYCYRCNGGPVGERFAERYLAVGWVVGVRVVLVTIATVIPCIVGLAFTSTGLNWFEDARVWFVVDLGVLGLITLVYWRMGVHLARIHNPSAQVTQGPASP